ncbi:MAG: hypothetical protein IJU65_03625 [Desulfovibrio sp.]|nr:hypothetical protein [Desulfovibrio sp.]
MTDIRAQLLSGSQAALLVPDLWQALPPQRRRYMVWDAGHLQGPEMLRRFVGLANHAVAGWVDGQFLGIAWIMPLTTGSRCGLIHMACTGEAWQAVAFGRWWLREILPKHYDSLLAFLPVAFRHVRHIVEELAFHVVTRIPGGACLTMRNNRITDAVLYQRNL